MIAASEPRAWTSRPPSGVAGGYIDHPAFDDPQWSKISAEEASYQVARLLCGEDGRCPTVEGLRGECLPGRAALLNSLCSSPILSAMQERILFCRMNYLRFRAHRLRGALGRPTGEPPVALLKMAHEIRNLLIQSNIRLVASIAKQFANERWTFDELLSEGIQCLIKATEKFNFARGFRFSTYATSAVRREILRLIRRTRRLDAWCLTGHVAEFVEPTTEDGMTDELCRAYTGLLPRLGELLSSLAEREQFILRARYGLHDLGGKPTFQRIGEALGISKERVRQLEIRALERLRSLIEIPPATDV